MKINNFMNNFFNDDNKINNNKNNNNKKKNIKIWNSNNIEEENKIIKNLDNNNISPMEKYKVALKNNKNYLERKNKYINDTRKVNNNINKNEVKNKKYILDKEELPEEYLLLQNKIKSQGNEIFTSGKNKGKKFNEVLKDKNYNNFILKKDNLK